MIYITGDTHGDFEHIIEFCDYCGTSEKDILIILGDAEINYFLNDTDYQLKAQLS